MSDKTDIEIQEFLSKTADILSKLDELDQPQFSRRIEDLKANIGSFSKRRVRSGLVGITSSGKSSLLNVLLGTGKKILKEQSKATTNMIVFCSRSEQPELEIHFEGREPVKKSGDSVLTESIWKYTSEDENPQNKHSVKYIKLALPTFLLEDDIEIADTPGLDAYGHKEHEDLTLREFLPQADLIIYLSSVRSPMKETDRKILNRVMDADQRVVFVQTCKGAVVEGNYGENSKESVDALLEKYRKEFERSIRPYARLKNSPIVQVETMQAIKFFKNKDLNAWKESGLEEFVHVVKGVTKQLQDEFALTNIRKIVDEVNALNTLIQSTVQEEGEQEGSIDAQTHQLNVLNDQYEQIVQDKDNIAAKWKGALDSSEIFKKYRLKLLKIFGNRYDYNPMHDKAFLTEAQNIRKKNQVIKHEFLNAMDSAKERYREFFDEIGLDVRRTDIQQVGKSAFYLPNVQKKRITDAAGTGGGSFWNQKKEVSVEYIDKNKFINELKISMKQFFVPLLNHLQWWENTINYAYLEPLKKKIASLKDDISNVKKGASYDDSQYRALTHITDGFEDVLLDIAHLCKMDISKRKLSSYIRSAARASAAGESADIRNIIVQLGSRLFEGMFHDYYLKCISRLSESGKKTIALIGDDREASVNFLRRLMRLDNNAALTLQKTEPPFAVNMKTSSKAVNSINIKGEFSDLLSFYVLSNDSKSFEAAKKAGIFKKADIIQVMISDLHRVGSALVDLTERNLFFEMMQENRNKLLLTYPGAAHFQKERLHILVLEAIAEINKLFAPDNVNWFLYENFEIRYSYFNDLALKILRGKSGPDEFIKEWKSIGIPLDEPFSEMMLTEQIEELVSSAEGETAG